jgi:glycosyl transferase family (putative galactosyltransferase)
MRGAIISACTADWLPLCDVTIPNRKDYCRRHGYDFIPRLTWTGDRKPAWARIELALAYLARYDTLFVMDVDAIITNPEIKIENLDIGHDLVATKDINGFNCGMMLLRPSIWSLDFLRRYWDVGLRYEHHTNPEQTCLAHMLICEPRDKWDIKRQRDFNSFRYEEYDTSFPEGQWEEGDFIMHLPALPNERRIEIFNEYFSSHR